MRAVMSVICILFFVSLAPHPAFATESGQSGSYTAEQVAANSTVSKCWTILEGAVYDLTEWIPPALANQQQSTIIGRCKQPSVGHELKVTDASIHRHEFSGGDP